MIYADFTVLDSSGWDFTSFEVLVHYFIGNFSWLNDLALQFPVSDDEYSSV